MGFLDWLFSRSHGAADAHLLSAVDRVLQGIDPRLKHVRGARDRLLPAVEQVLAFAAETVNSLPPSIRCSPETWATTPLLRAMFARPADLGHVLSASEELRRFIDDGKAGGHVSVFAVIAATMSERTTLGAGLDGDMLRQDMVLRTVSFDDYNVAAIATTEDATRRAIGDFVLEQVVLAALDDVAAERRHGEELKRYRQLLLTRLRLMERSGANLGALYAADRDREADLDRLRTELAENEAELAAMEGGRDLEHALDHLIDALRNAEAIVRPRWLHLRLNAMNVLVEPSAPDGVLLDLLEFSTANPERSRRVAFLASIAPDSVAVQHMDFDAALRSL